MQRFPHNQTIFRTTRSHSSAVTRCAGSFIIASLTTCSTIPFRGTRQALEPDRTKSRALWPSRAIRSRCILFAPGYRSKSPVAAVRRVIAREKISEAGRGVMSGEVIDGSKRSSGAVKGGVKAVIDVFLSIDEG